MLRGVRRRWRGRREEPLACFTVRVLAVSPYPEEPEDESYTPTLLVESAPDPGDPALGPGQVAVGALLFVAWAQRRLGTAELPLRLRAVLPRLRHAVEVGAVGPERYAAHRATQHERYFHQREAATYAVELRRDEDGLYVAVTTRVAKGRWTPEAAVLQAATMAPYEALLRLAAPEQRALLAWLERAVARWLDGHAPDFPVADWDPAAPLAPPGEV
ncbi:MAG TPA: hypothetical protein VFL91_01000 [Thermomicrobiales bacterium]|nr:hypothetical protein [Thermomicrobiales bacterium]